MTLAHDQHRYRVSIPERLRVLMLDALIGELDEVSYTWGPGGYERLVVRRHRGGEVHHSGLYHPGDGTCDVGGDGAGECSYCGMRWFD